MRREQNNKLTQGLLDQKQARSEILPQKNQSVFEDDPHWHALDNRRSFPFWNRYKHIQSYILHD